MTVMRGLQLAQLWTALHTSKNMALPLYLSASFMVFLLSLGSFLRDPSNPKTRVSSWMFLAMAMLGSPVTLPSMLYKRLTNPDSVNTFVQEV
jgi:hypothetical protein